MINFRGIEFAYKQLNTNTFPTTCQADIASQVKVTQKLEHMIIAMKIANMVVIDADDMVGFKGCPFFRTAVHECFLDHDNVVETAQLALQIKYGDVTLTREGNRFVKVVWKSKICHLKDEDRQALKDCDLFIAVIAAGSDDIKTCLKKGANPNALGPFGRTPVYAIMNNPEIITILAEAGGKMNVRDKFDLTPGMVANVFDPNSEFSRLIRRYA